MFWQGGKRVLSLHMDVGGCMPWARSERQGFSVKEAPSVAVGGIGAGSPIAATEFVATISRCPQVCGVAGSGPQPIRPLWRVLQTLVHVVIPTQIGIHASRSACSA